MAPTWRRNDVREKPTDRQSAVPDKAAGVSRRAQALLAAAGESEPHRRWYVLTIANRAEKGVEKALQDSGIEAWLPVSEVQPPRRSGRKKQRSEPVRVLAWPGYIFVKVANTPRSWAGLALVEGVVSVLGTAECPAPISDDIVLKLKLFLEEDEEARITLVNGFRVQDEVRVCSGPFASFLGVVVWLGDSDRMKVEVNIFGRSTVVDLELAQVVKLK